MKALITDRSGPGGKGVRGLKNKVRAMALSLLSELSLKEAELSILLTDDAEIKGLNRQYLGKDRPTDVLSFEMEDPVILGDVVISVERAGAQALALGFSFDAEIARLLVHGTLHLLGFEHERGGRQAAKMKRREDELLAVLKAGGLC